MDSKLKQNARLGIIHFMIRKSDMATTLGKFRLSNGSGCLNNGESSFLCLFRASDYSGS